MARNWRINILALIGAIIGLISIFIIWKTEAYGFIRGVQEEDAAIYNFNILNMISLGGSYPGTFIDPIVGIIVLSGVIMSFLTPIGGIIEVIGASVFIISEGRLPVYGDWHWGLTIYWGSFLALASGVILIFSIYKPMYRKSDKGPIEKKERLLTFSKLPALPLSVNK
jgi:hypothetical protein